jgi:hypothetical protein
MLCIIEFSDTISTTITCTKTIIYTMNLVWSP